MTKNLQRARRLVDFTEETIWTEIFDAIEGCKSAAEITAALEETRLSRRQSTSQKIEAKWQELNANAEPRRSRGATP